MAERETCELLRLDLPKAGASRADLPAADDLEVLGATAKALGDPTRLAVAVALRVGERACVCDPSWIVVRHEKLVSHHLRLLKSAGPARSQREARWSCTS